MSSLSSPICVSGFTRKVPVSQLAFFLSVISHRFTTISIGDSQSRVHTNDPTGGRTDPKCIFYRTGTTAGIHTHARIDAFTIAAKAFKRNWLHFCCCISTFCFGLPPCLLRLYEWCDAASRTRLCSLQLWCQGFVFSNRF